MLGRERWAILLLAVAGAGFLPGALDRFVFPKLALAAGGVAAGAVTSRSRHAAAAGGGAAGAGGVDPARRGARRRRRRWRSSSADPRATRAWWRSRCTWARWSAAPACSDPGGPAGSTAWLLDGLAIAALAIGVEAALEAAGLRPLVSNVARPGSLLGNASDQGAWAVLASVRWRRWRSGCAGALHRAGAVAAAVALATSGSRGALAGAVVLARRPDRAGRRVAGPRLAIAAGVAILALGVLALPATRGAGADQHATRPSRPSTGRRLLWGETVTLVGDHPLLGVGPSGYVDAIPAYHDRRYEAEIGPANPPDSPARLGAAGGRRRRARRWR